MLDFPKIKAALKVKANQLGFTHIGIAASLPVPYIEAFQGWVSAGYQADMHYLARPDTLAKRADPQLILENCQRVICLAMPYQPPAAPLSEIPSGFGRISAYARTTDYHETIQDKLGVLNEFLHTSTEDAARCKSYVDTGPILERAFATQAGIGMLGKNSNLIVPGVGSYFFLAEILTNLPLPVDPPFSRDVCGSCQRCIDACPTGCILTSRTIDARSCISYLTIENKGIIPDGLKSLIGNWFFGCDVCQMVCPHNTRVAYQTGPLGQPQLPECIDLTEILTWRQEDYRSATEKTALTRPKLHGLLRNAAIVLGNQSDTRALPHLYSRLAQEADPVLRDSLGWAIRQIEHSPHQEHPQHDD